MADVIVRIDEDAKAEVEVVGGSGKGCKALLAAFDFGGDVKDEGVKPEFYQQENQNVVRRGG